MSGSRRRRWLKALLIVAVIVLIGGTYLNYIAPTLPKEGESKPGF